MCWGWVLPEARRQKRDFRPSVWRAIQYCLDFITLWEAVPRTPKRKKGKAWTSTAADHHRSSMAIWHSFTARPCAHCCLCRRGAKSRCGAGCRCRRSPAQDTTKYTQTHAHAHTRPHTHADTHTLTHARTHTRTRSTTSKNDQKQSTGRLVGGLEDKIVDHDLRCARIEGRRTTRG